MLIKFNKFILFLSLILTSVTYAETLIIKDEYDYNPLNETGNEACIKLEEKIKLKAIAKISGENISQDMLEICDGTNDFDQCISNTSTFYSLGNAKILDFKITEGPFFQEKSDLLNNHLRCRMTARIELSNIESLDQNFDFDIETNNTMFNAPVLMQDSTGKPIGDYPILEVSIRTTSNMYLYFFNYLTYDKNKNQINIIPTKELRIKNNEFKKRIIVTFPRNINQNIVNEYLYIIGSNKKIDFLKDYNLYDFNKKLIDLYESKNFKVKDRQIGIQIVKKWMYD